MKQAFQISRAAVFCQVIGQKTVKENLKRGFPGNRNEQCGKLPALKC
jgi:hypothetical protein